MSGPSNRYSDLHALLGRRRLDQDVVEELEHHFDRLVEGYLKDGLDPEQARTAALERFGDFEQARADTTAVDRKSHRWLELSETVMDAWRGIRLAARGLRRRPEFSVFAVLTLTVALGAFAALFSVLERLVISPLPYDDADRLVWLDSPVPGVGPDAAWGLSQAGYFDLAENTSSLESLGGFSVGAANMTSDAGPARVRTAAVTASLVSALRLRPVEGRLIGEADDVPGGPAVVMLDHGFWQSRFGGDPNAVGTTIEVNGATFEVVGILERGHGLPDISVDLWQPLQLDPTARPVNAHWLSAAGRLADGVPIDRARAEVDQRTAGFIERFPTAYSTRFVEESGFRTRLTPLKAQVLGGIGRTIWILFAASGLLLLIALANITNLYLVRTEARRRDFSVRTALGASRRHLTWHCLTETVLLSTVAGLLALPVAHAGISLLQATAPPGLPRLGELAIGPAVVAFTLIVSLGIGLSLGLVPLAYSLLGERAGFDGGGGPRATVSRRRQGVRRVMLAGQMALALVLLSGGGLMLRSMNELRSTEPGFETEGVLLLEAFVPWSSYGGYEEVGQFYREFLDRVSALPGVVSAGATTRMPIVDVGSCAAVFVEDRPAETQDAPPCLPVALATPGFFESLDIPIEGMAPGWAEMTDGSGPAVVTRALADRLWPGESAVGKGIRGNGPETPFYRVVGVARDFRSEGLDRPPIEAVFFPMYPIEGAPLWSPPNAMRIAVRSSGDPAALTPAIRAVLRELDPDVPLANVRPFEAAVNASPSVSRTSFSLLLLGIAAALALGLSTIGMYGVVSQLVVERSREIAVRLALGARLREVIAMVVGQSMRVALVGVAIGVIGALAGTRALRAALFQIQPTDPLTYVLASGTLLGTVAAATFLAARRATRVDPVETLRSD
jgi:predicted permease